jgi:arylsulfatase A-like enzyme
MKETIDAPISQLILDLEERGLLDRTLVIVASEFGRDMITEGKPDKPVKDQVNQQPEILTELKHYGMHRHFTEASSVLVFGGGFKKGFVYGETADERPCKIVKNPISIEDLHATLYWALGVPPNHGYVVEKRPFYVTKDGKGKPVLDLLA